MPSHVQAESSSTADKGQEAYRGYLLRRLLPAITAYYEHRFLSMDDIDAAESLTADGVMERLASLTTRQLERRLAHFYQGLLNVRIPDSLQASASRLQQVLAMQW